MATIAWQRHESFKLPFCYNNAQINEKVTNTLSKICFMHYFQQNLTFNFTAKKWKLFEGFQITCWDQTAETTGLARRPLFKATMRVMLAILVCVWGWLNSGEFQKMSDTVELPHETEIQKQNGESVPAVKICGVCKQPNILRKRHYFGKRVCFRTWW